MFKIDATDDFIACGKLIILTIDQNPFSITFYSVACRPKSVYVFHKNTTTPLTKYRVTVSLTLVNVDIM